ncbi:MAG: STAS domain-containing protein [Aggregatilineales bacterium]
MVDVNVSNHNNVTLIEVSGRIDSMTANQLGDALGTEIDGGNVNVVLDLSHVDYMSSAGLREIVTALKKVKRSQGNMVLAQPSDRVREVLEMAGLDTIFRIFAGQDEAISSF